MITGPGLSQTIHLASRKARHKAEFISSLLGIIALITGMGELPGVDLPGLAILLILLGANLVLKPWLEEMKLFGKAEES